MATGTILLPVLGAVGIEAAPVGVGFTATNKRPYLIFDGAGALEGCVWTFRMPENYASGPVAKIQWSGSSSTTVTHTCQWTVNVLALTPNVDGAADSTSFDNGNIVTDDILGTTAKRIQEISVTLTNNDSAAADDNVSILLRRDSAHANDDLPEDAWLWAMSIEYTTT